MLLAVARYTPKWIMLKNICYLYSHVLYLKILFLKINYKWMDGCLCIAPVKLLCFILQNKKHTSYQGHTKPQFPWLWFTKEHNFLCYNKYLHLLGLKLTKNNSILRGEITPKLYLHLEFWLGVKFYGEKIKWCVRKKYQGQVCTQRMVTEGWGKKSIMRKFILIFVLFMGEIWITQL